MRSHTLVFALMTVSKFLFTYKHGRGGTFA
jgi:hypothetical protein